MAIHKREIFIVAMLGSFIGPYTGSSVNVALPTIGKELGMNTFMLSWVQLAYLLATAVCILPMGRWADMIGNKAILFYGTVVFSVMSVFCSISWMPSMLILARTLQGVGGAAVAVTVVAMVSSAFPLGERGKILGLTAASTYTGLSAGPFIGGLLTTYFGWHSVFLVVLPVTGVMLLFLSRIPRERRPDVQLHFDSKGAVVYGIGLLCLMGGLTVVHTLSGFVLLLAGIVVMAYFARLEAGAEMPLLDMRLLIANKVMLFSSSAALINYCATFSAGYLLSLQMQAGMGFSPRAAGMVLVAQPVVQAIISPISGKLSDRTDPGVVASIGMAVTTLGLILFILAPADNVFFIVGILCLMGFGLALFVSPNTNAIMNAVDKTQYGAASGILGTSRSVGQAFSMGFTALIMTMIMGNVPIAAGSTELFLRSYRVCFGFMAFLCFIGIFASLARRKSTDVA